MPDEAVPSEASQHPAASASPDRGEPATEEVEQARREFYDTFETHCTAELDSRAHRRLGEIFAMTVVHGLNEEPGSWSSYRDFALHWVREIATRAHAAANGGMVTRPVLVMHADAAIREAIPVCIKALGGGPGGGPKRIFCEDYVFETEEVQTTSGETPEQMAARAWVDFQQRFHDTCEEGPVLADDVPGALRALFDRTVGKAILERGHVWDLNTTVSKFALKRLHDVAALAIVTAGSEINADILRDSANTVIEKWSPTCRMKGIAKIFCEPVDSAA